MTALPIPPLASDATPPLLPLLLLSVLPAAASQNGHFHVALSFPPRLIPKGPSCLFVLALLGRGLLAHCPWRRGEGSLANKGRSQVEAPGRRRRRGFPTSTGRGRPRGPASPCSPLSSSSLCRYERGSDVTRALVSSLSRELSGAISSCRQ